MYFGFESISINYDKKQVLDDISLEIPRGKIVTIIGQNGCGKSSLLKLINKNHKKNGKIYLEDKLLADYKSKDRAKKIAYLPQTHTTPDDIDVETLVSYGRYPYTRIGKGLTKEDKDAVNRALESAGISHLAKQCVNTLSGGERQRAWIAMTVCQEPDILILDEPTTYLDICYQIEVLELVKYLNEQLNMTIVMVLHDLNLASKYSDYLYVIKDKKVFLKGTPKDIITKDNLRDIFRINAEVYDNGYPYFITEGIAKGNI